MRRIPNRWTTKTKAFLPLDRRQPRQKDWCSMKFVFTGARISTLTSDRQTRRERRVEKVRKDI